MSKEIIEPLSVDCVIFGFEDALLKVLLYKRSIEPCFDMWALPGGFIRYDENNPPEVVPEGSKLRVNVITQRKDNIQINSDL